MKHEERKQHQTHDADTFLEYRKKQEQVHLNRIKGSTNPLDAILTIELNTTELCNRKCVFCPRHDSSVYPNRNLNMSVDTAEKIANVELRNSELKVQNKALQEVLASINGAKPVTEEE